MFLYWVKGTISIVRIVKIYNIAHVFYAFLKIHNSPLRCCLSTCSDDEQNMLVELNWFHLLYIIYERLSIGSIWMIPKINHDSLMLLIQLLDNNKTENPSVLAAGIC